eukprot:TRINITY_DN2891_c0_g1_i1.p1 TRINITY_DN2891_c0_g1~~TRINITY_DN2891_c0_g1_i1.p1  ORF type:complete len:143 (+),score=11.15 TRINITY_DN2891_c0_g1_i1:199-627(+)
MQDNNLPIETGMPLGRLLSATSSLLSLNLKGNRIGPGGATQLAEALKTNRSLVQLDLEGNDIQDGGAISIAEALLINRTLTNLNISNNRVGVSLDFTLLLQPLFMSTQAREYLARLCLTSSLQLKLYSSESMSLNSCPKDSF